MEIHAPEGPTHSFKDFAIHIVIVTIGILIALGLEGLRETWREHKAISEARESFDQELHLDQRFLALEVAAVGKANDDLKRIEADLPVLSKTPAELTKRVMDIKPGFYFFRTTAWESAVASGVLAHMNHEEVSRYADVYLSIRNYQDAQKASIPVWLAVQAFYLSHHTLSPAEQAAGEEKLQSFQLEMTILDHLSGEFSGGLNSALLRN
jgi:hypothetical protein